VKQRFPARRDKLRRPLKKLGLEALLVTDLNNVTYLTGFTGDDSYLLVRRDGEVLISDPRYATQLEEECPGLEVFIRKPGVAMLQGLLRILKDSKLGKVGIEADSMSVGLRDNVADGAAGLEVVPTTGLVERLRRIKDKDEITQIRHSIHIAQRAFAVLRATLCPEKTEKQVANELEYQMRSFGARSVAFPSIVAVGPRAALPHAPPTDRTVGSGDILLVDWGAAAGLYRSDLTRVLITGKISPKLERIYRVVLSAQLAAIEAIRPGVACGEVDRVARQRIAKEGYGRYFGHGLGHGVGLQVHEAPRMAARGPGTLRPGMVVTVEPGIYLPGWGGVRIEDDVLVTPTGHEVLTSVPKQWEDVFVA
jgi:Xaa-Pro aminopeptidase